jgi:hypothetical protein
MRKGSLGTMIVGLVLALGMGGLLLGWSALDDREGLIGFLFIGGVVAGVVVVLIGATSTSQST